MLTPIHNLIGIPEGEDAITAVTAEQLQQADLALLTGALAFTLYAGVIAIIRRTKKNVVVTVEIMVGALEWPSPNPDRDGVFACAIGAAIGQLAAEGAPVDHSEKMETDSDTGFTVTISNHDGGVVARAIRDRFAEVFERAKELIALAGHGPGLVAPPQD